MKIKYDTRSFQKEMNNLIQYSLGFFEGVERGKPEFYKSVGALTVEMLKQYIDSNARVNPDMLHHIYEWYQTGSSSARLFDINYTVSALGITFVGTLTQSKSIKNGSSTPFYDKASIIESGTPVVIRPKNAQALSFVEDGEEIFVKTPVTVENPGGSEAQGGFERIMDSFFNRYFSQAFLESSGILRYLRNPVAFSKNLRLGTKMGKSKGLEVGYRWITNATGGMENV
jgi:hypothetical protein